MGGLAESDDPIGDALQAGRARPGPKTKRCASPTVRGPVGYRAHDRRAVLNSPSSHEIPGLMHSEPLARNRAAKGRKTMTQARRAKALGISIRHLRKLEAQGCPPDLAGAREWRAQRRRTTREPAPDDAHP